jgi:hypothetical protein
MIERIMREYRSAYQLRSISFRYFNASGTDARDKSNETGKEVPFDVRRRRPGDPPVLVADPESGLGFRPQQSDLQTIIRSGWNWHRKAHPAKTAELINTAITEVSPNPRQKRRNQCGTRASDCADPRGRHDRAGEEPAEIAELKRYGPHQGIDQDGRDWGSADGARHCTTEDPDQYHGWQDQDLEAEPENCA